MLQPNCPNCETAMHRGFLTHGKVNAAYLDNRWISGEPWSYVLGMSEELAVTTFRCPKCGRLESYASAPSPSRKECDGDGAARIGANSIIFRSQTMKIE